MSDKSSLLPNCRYGDTDWYIGSILRCQSISQYSYFYPGQPQKILPFSPTVDPNPEFGWKITTTSGEAEIGLANHLAKIGAKEYVAYWCPHCHEQKLLFGQEAYKIIDNSGVKVECAPGGLKAQPDSCKAAKIEGFPTWIINGKSYSGVQNLEELAKVSNYTGTRNFQYFR